MLSKKLSIIAPTYNEADNVLYFIERVKATLNAFDWEILFVDDNSSDGTAQKIFENTVNDNRVRAIIRLEDRSLARSSIQGMLSAKGDLLCVMDVDGQHDPAVLSDLVARLDRDNLDIVSAARKLESADKLHALSPLRRKISLFGNWFSSLILDRKLSDPLTGFFLIRRNS
ncbi:MAG: glycosyltransferase, partial [Rhizobium sp.]